MCQLLLPGISCMHDIWDQVMGIMLLVRIIQNNRFYVYLRSVKVKVSFGPQELEIEKNTDYTTLLIFNNPRSTILPLFSPVQKTISTIVGLFFFYLCSNKTNSLAKNG